MMLSTEWCLQRCVSDAYGVGDTVGDDIGNGVSEGIGDDVGDAVCDGIGLRRIAPLGFRNNPG